MCYHRRMMRRWPSLVASCCCLAVAGRARPTRAIRWRARGTLYNQRQFEAALAAADEARRPPDARRQRRSDRRARVSRALPRERRRRRSDARARAAAPHRPRRASSPRAARVSRRSRRRRCTSTTRPAPRPTIFESVLDRDARSVARGARARARLVGERARSRRAAAAGDRAPGDLSAHSRSDARRSWPRIPASAPASYWLAAAARGQGDLQAAWDAAQAGWVRAPLAADRGAALRADLDRLVQRAHRPRARRAIARRSRRRSLQRGVGTTFKEKLAD